MKYNIIYADPPWPYKNFCDKAHGAARAHYKLMEMDDIKALPVENMAAEDCILFMWATFPKLPEAIETVRAWGFEYKTAAFVWVKKNAGGQGYFHGVGFHTASNAEVCLLGKRGSLERVNKDVSQLIVSPIRGHSQKPLETYGKIERLYGNIPRIELFAREAWDGWEVWGDEAPTTVQKTFEVKQ